MGNISQDPTISSTRVTSVRLFSQIVCLLVCLYTSLFFKEIFFYKCSWYYLGDYLTKETFFPASLLLPRAILRYFWAYFGVCSSSFESCLSSYLIKFYPDAFCITLIVSVLRKISQHLSLCWGTLCNILGAYFGYITQCLEKRVTFS